MSTQVVKRIVVLISGSGSNLQSIIDACESKLINAEIVGVISNKVSAYGLERAKSQHISIEAIDHTKFNSRDSFDAELMSVIDGWNADFVILAGFMRILTPKFTEHYIGRLVNIHPSLLPKYPGLNTHQRAIEAKDTHAGASIHFVTAELDGGPVILQAKVPIGKKETSDSLARKVLRKEHVIYPQAIQWLCNGRLILSGNVAILDGKPLTERGANWV